MQVPLPVMLASAAFPSILATFDDRHAPMRRERFSYASAVWTPRYSSTVKPCAVRAQYPRRIPTPPAHDLPETRTKSEARVAG